MRRRGEERGRRLEEEASEVGRRGNRGESRKTSRRRRRRRGHIWPGHQRGPPAIEPPPFCTGWLGCVARVSARAIGGGGWRGRV
jgi:hypothetical protein